MADKKKRRKPQNGRPTQSAGRPVQRDTRSAPPHAGNAAQGRNVRPNGRPQQPAMPQTRRAMNKQMRTRYTTPRRHRARGGNYILYYLLAAVVIIIVFVILANTLLFNCSKIEVEGSVRYTADEIIETSGIKIGDNLLHINEKAAEQRITGTLAYIDIADVSRSFPTGIKITVTEAEKWYSLEQDGKTVSVSRGGKIIESGKTSGLPVVKGFEAESMDVGVMLKSTVENKNALPEEILSAAEKAGLKSITEIDLTDRFSIIIQCDSGRITLEIGNITDIESKLYVAQTLIRDELSPTEEVTILLTDPEKVAVHNKNADDNFIPVIPEDTSEETSTAETSEETGQA